MLLAVEVSAIGIGAVADRLEHVTIVGHVNVFSKACIPVSLTELVDHAREPVELASVAEHVEVALEGSIVELRVTAIDAEAVLELMRRNCAARRVAVAIDFKRCTVAIEFSTCINLASFYIIRYRISIGVKALIPCNVCLVAIEQEAKLTAFERLVGQPVTICALVACALIVEVCEVEAVRHRQCVRLEADELAVPTELVASHISAINGAEVDAVRHRTASLVNPRAECCGGCACNLACVKAVLQLDSWIATLAYAEDAGSRTCGGCNSCFVHTVFDNER